MKFKTRIVSIIVVVLCLILLQTFVFDYDWVESPFLTQFTPPARDWRIDDICDVRNHIVKVELLAVIHSEAKDYLLRDVIRKTWCSYSQRNTANMRCVFLLGKIKSTLGNKMLTDEVDENRDMVFGTFSDDMDYTTLRTMSGYRWATKYCRHAKHVLSTNTHTWLNIPNLLDILAEVDSIDTLFKICNPVPSDGKTILLRKKVSLLCSNVTRILTSESVAKLVDIAPSIPIRKEENIYISTCARSLEFDIKVIPGYTTYTDEHNVCSLTKRNVTVAKIDSMMPLEKLAHANCGDTTMHSVWPHTQAHTAHWLKLAHPKNNPRASEICRLNKDEDKIDLLVMIMSRVKEVELRMAIRDTWCSYSKGNTANLRCVFLLSDNKWGNISLDTNLTNEVEKYNDIVLGSFVDSYKNCTLKVMMGYLWADKYCSHAHNVLKTDVDVWINIPYVLRYLGGINMNSKIVGRCKCGVPRRSKYDKHPFTYHEYPDKTFGTVCDGTMYVMSLESVKKLIQLTASESMFLWVEDVFISLSAQKLNLTFHLTHGLVKENFITLPNDCVYKSDLVKLAHLRNIDQLKNIMAAECEDYIPGFIDRVGLILNFKQ